MNNYILGTIWHHIFFQYLASNPCFSKFRITSCFSILTGHTAFPPSARRDVWPGYKLVATVFQQLAGPGSRPCRFFSFFWVWDGVRIWKITCWTQKWRLVQMTFLFKWVLCRLPAVHFPGCIQTITGHHLNYSSLLIQTFTTLNMKNKNSTVAPKTVHCPNTLPGHWIWQFSISCSILWLRHFGVHTFLRQSWPLEFHNDLAGELIHQFYKTDLQKWFEMHQRTMYDKTWCRLMETNRANIWNPVKIRRFSSTAWLGLFSTVCLMLAP